eukprot:scaffold11761_cov18-Tisochrysis_lutea.AAC.2
MSVTAYKQHCPWAARHLFLAGPHHGIAMSSLKHCGSPGVLPRPLLHHSRETLEAHPSSSSATSPAAGSSAEPYHMPPHLKYPPQRLLLPQ